MLTGYQCETVAFTLDGSIICPDCAVKATSAVTVAKAERGLSIGFDLGALSRYSLDEYISESHYSDDEDETEAPDEYPCDHCGRDIS